MFKITLDSRLRGNETERKVRKKSHKNNYQKTQSKIKTQILSTKNITSFMPLKSTSLSLISK